MRVSSKNTVGSNVQKVISTYLVDSNNKSTTSGKSTKFSDNQKGESVDFCNSSTNPQFPTNFKVNDSPKA